MSEMSRRDFALLSALFYLGAWIVLALCALAAFAFIEPRQDAMETAITAFMDRLVGRR